MHCSVAVVGRDRATVACLEPQVLALFSGATVVYLLISSVTIQAHAADMPTVILTQASAATPFSPGDFKMRAGIVD